MLLSTYLIIPHPLPLANCRLLSYTNVLATSVSRHISGIRQNSLREQSVDKNQHTYGKDYSLHFDSCCIQRVVMFFPATRHAMDFSRRELPIPV